MKHKAYLALLVIVCMICSLLPTTAFAVDPVPPPVTAGTHEELLTALTNVGDGGTITLTAAITGDPININSYTKTFSIDKTTGNFAYPTLTGYYTGSASCYTAYGYGMDGVAMTHAKSYVLKVDTFTYAPVDDSTIAAYVSRETASAASFAYACTDMATALSKISGPYYTFLHLKQDFIETVGTTKSTNFTLLPDGHQATGTIQYTGTSPYEVTMAPLDGSANFSVSFKYISFTVENGATTKGFGSAEFADAVTYANGCVGATTMTVGSLTISAPVTLDSDVQLVIPSGKTVTLAAQLTVNGTFTNNGTVTFRNTGKLTILTSATTGLFMYPVNYLAMSTADGTYTTYWYSAETNAEVVLLRGDDTVGLYYGTLAEAVSDTTTGSIETIKLLKNVTAASGQKISGNVDAIDLNGFTLSTAAGSYLNASDGDVTIRDSSTAKTGKVTGGSSSYGLFTLAYSGNITFESGTFEDLGGTAAVGAYGRTTAGSVITVGSDATVTSTGYGIIINEAGRSAGYSDTTVNIYGSVQGTYAGITINGQIAISPTPVINIYSGSEVSGIYAAGYGTWNISGGTVSSATGIYMKSGVLNVTGGTISGTGTLAAPVYNGNGFDNTGDAVVIDSCGYPGGAPSVRISGGSLTSTNAYALRHVMTQGTTPANSLAIRGGIFTGATDPAVISDGPTGFISGGKYAVAPTLALVAPGYMYDSVTQYVIPATAAASVGGTAYASLALAVNAAKYGETIDLLTDNNETLTVSKVVTIRLNNHMLGTVLAGEGYERAVTPTEWSFTMKSDTTTVVSVSVEGEIGDGVPFEDANAIADVIDLTKVNGVTEALSETGTNSIIGLAGVTPDPDDQVAVEINVAVTATESNLEEGTLTFSAVPTANVYLNGAKENDSPVPVPNSALNGSEIEILLPLPEGYTPLEIVHRSADGTIERFLDSATYPDAAQKFVIVTIDSQRFAKLTITKFSTFDMSGTASSMASIGVTEYVTLQEAIDTATTGQTITLLQDCSEPVTISGKSIVIERGTFTYDKSFITLGAYCTLAENGTALTITSSYVVTAVADPTGSIRIGGSVALTATVDGNTEALSVITYQWYRSETNGTAGGIMIAGAINPVYRPSTSTVGTAYYYCVVGRIASNVVGVTVTSASHPTPNNTNPSHAPGFDKNDKDFDKNPNTGAGSAFMEWPLLAGVGACILVLTVGSKKTAKK